MQILRLIMCNFIKKHQVNAENGTQLKPAAWKFTKCTHLHTSNQLPQLTEDELHPSTSVGSDLPSNAQIPDDPPSSTNIMHRLQRF